MIERAKMTELVDNDVVRKFMIEIEKPVIKIQIPLSGAASPAGALVTNTYILVFKAVETIEMNKP
jgi:hypothetical protein